VTDIQLRFRIFEARPVMETVRSEAPKPEASNAKSRMMFLRRGSEPIFHQMGVVRLPCGIQPPKGFLALI